MRPILFVFAILFTSQVLGQTGLTKGCHDKIDYFESGEIKRKYKICDGELADTFAIYLKNGDLDKVLDYGPPGSDQPIYFIDYLEKGDCRKITGTQVFDKQNKAIKVGTWKYFWKNDVLMDSVVYDNGIELSRAHFSKKGLLKTASNSEETTIYNKNGTVKSIKKK